MIREMVQGRNGDGAGFTRDGPGKECCYNNTVDGRMMRSLIKTVGT